MVQMMLTMKTHPRRTEQMLRAFRSVSLLARAEPGLVSCRLLIDAEQSDALCYIEEWATAADLDEQIRSSRYTQLLALMEEAAELPDLRLNWVRETKGLEYLEAVKLCDG
jgi:quinol monooxygenase YgiN